MPTLKWHRIKPRRPSLKLRKGPGDRSLHQTKVLQPGGRDLVVALSCCEVVATPPLQLDFSRTFLLPPLSVLSLYLRAGSFFLTGFDFS
jgi:hypothetical protein